MTKPSSMKANTKTTKPSNGKTNKTSKNETAKNKTTLPFSFRRAVLAAILSIVVYHTLIMCYIFYHFTQAATGPFGSTLAVTDDMSARFPNHFAVVQQMALLPIPNHAAKQYYQQQLPVFQQAARDFTLHPYWFTHNFATSDMTFRQVVTERMRSMYWQFQQEQQQDDGNNNNNDDDKTTNTGNARRLDSYRIEKDRCAQFDFFENNHIPYPRIPKRWADKDEVIQQIMSDEAIQDITKWPVFFKACHLTQRSSLGTFAIASPQAFQDRKHELVQWIQDKWEYRSRDVDRPWQMEGDALTDQLTPSILLQEPMTDSARDSGDDGGDDKTKDPAGFHVNGRISLGLVEIKVEVMWGLVYIMQMDAVTIFLRNGEMEDYSTFMGAILHSPTKATARSTWIRDEGYLDCVIQTAERVARAAHIDYVRVDIFLDKGDPNNCAVNEISLSSGYAYYGHEDYMAKIWAGPLEEKMYQVLNSTEPVYELVEES